MSVYQNINGTLARMDASDLVQLAAVDTEGILGGTPGATTDGQTLVDQLAADDVQTQTDIGQIKTDLSNYLTIADEQELGAYNLADCDMATSTMNGFTATKGTLNNGVTYTITGADTGSTGAQFIIEDDGKFLAQMKRYAGKRLKLVGCPAGGNSTSGYFLAVYFNYGAGDTSSAFYDVGNGIEMTVPATVNTARLAITLRHAATFSNTVFRPMVTPILTATYADFVGFAMTNRELTEKKVDILKRTLTSSDDLNNIIETGIYSASTTPSNAPDNQSYFSMFVFGNNEISVVRQIIYCNSGASSAIYTRTYSAGTWKSWVKFTGTVVS